MVETVVSKVSFISTLVHSLAISGTFFGHQWYILWPSVVHSLASGTFFGHQWYILWPSVVHSLAISGTFFGHDYFSLLYIAL
jgi:hypothetical protein